MQSGIMAHLHEEGMGCLSMERSHVQADVGHDDLLALAFGLGWAAADEAHLPALPEALARVLAVSGARIAIVHWNGTPLMEHAYPPPDEQGGEGPLLLHEIEDSLGSEYTFRLSIESVAELSDQQRATLDQAARLIHQALDCILIRQRDRAALGAPFAQLSDRAWRICLALERPDGEKEIARALECSRHTVHSCVKSLYRTLQVQSRLQMLDLLKRAREQLRRRTLESFGALRADRSRRESPAPECS